MAPSSGSNEDSGGRGARGRRSKLTGHGHARGTWARTFAFSAASALVVMTLTAVVSASNASSRQAGSLAGVTAARGDAGDSKLVAKGEQVFRSYTFGDQAFWGGTVQLDKAIEGAKNGGVGPGLSPAAALGVGLKVDVDALPDSVKQGILNGTIDLNDPATTLALLKLNAVIGVKGVFNSDGTLNSVGIECALCHSTVDNSFAPGIGHRLDGWANRDLNVGAIIGLAPNLKPVASLLGVSVATVHKVLNAWGPGKFDAELFLDGKGFQPDGRSAATLIPPAFGLAGINLHTWTGWGSIPYWNAFVAVLEMHGQGDFTDARLDNAKQFPIAAKNHFGHVTVKQDRVTKVLPALQAYELSLRAPKPPAGSFNAKMAAAGKALFDGPG